MLYVVDRRNRSAYLDQIEQMYRIRHRIYVDGRGWKALAQPDGREIDQFDTENAIYLLGIDSSGHVTSGVRLMPTILPTLMRDVFSHVAAWGDIPQSKTVFEMTRYFITEAPGDRVARRAVAGEVLSAMFEYALAAKLEKISVVCDAFFMTTMLECRWKIRPLGMPAPYPEGICVAVLIDVCQTALDNLRMSRGLTQPCLTFSALPPPHARSETNETLAA
jgi:acyl-homoserine lactone synthase